MVLVTHYDENIQIMCGEPIHVGMLKLAKCIINLEQGRHVFDAKGELNPPTEVTNTTDFKDAFLVYTSRDLNTTYRIGPISSGHITLARLPEGFSNIADFCASLNDTLKLLQKEYPSIRANKTLIPVSLNSINCSESGAVYFTEETPSAVRNIVVETRNTKAKDRNSAVPIWYVSMLNDHIHKIFLEQHQSLEMDAINIQTSMIIVDFKKQQLTRFRDMVMRCDRISVEHLAGNDRCFRTHMYIRDKDPKVTLSAMKLQIMRCFKKNDCKAEKVLSFPSVSDSSSLAKVPKVDFDGDWKFPELTEWRNVGPWSVQWVQGAKFEKRNEAIAAIGKTKIGNLPANISQDPSEAFMEDFKTAPRSHFGRYLMHLGIDLFDTSRDICMSCRAPLYGQIYVANFPVPALKHHKIGLCPYCAVYFHRSNIAYDLEWASTIYPRSFEDIMKKETVKDMFRCYPFTSDPDRMRELLLAMSAAEEEANQVSGVFSFPPNTSTTVISAFKSFQNKFRTIVQYEAELKNKSVTIGAVYDANYSVDDYMQVISNPQLHLVLGIPVHSSDDAYLSIDGVPINDIGRKALDSDDDDSC